MTRRCSLVHISPHNLQSGDQRHEDDKRVRIVSSIRNGISLSLPVKEALYDTVAHFRKRLIAVEPIDGVEILSEAVFSLDYGPQVIFKIADDSGRKDMVERWGYVQRAAEICKKQQLDLLVLPQQSLYEVYLGREILHVIAEERLPLTNNALVHARLYETFAEDFEPTLQQLVAFIAASGFRDVDFRNIPVLDRAAGSDTAPQIGLVDLEDCGDITGECQRWTYELALFGNGRGIRGLFGCIAPRGFPAVKEAMLSRGIDLEALYPGMYTGCLEKRESELEVARRSRELVANTEVFEREVKRILLTITTALSIGVSPNHPQIATEPLSEIGMRHGLCSGGLVSRRFRATVLDKKGLDVHGVIVLDLDTTLTVAVGLVINGSITSSTVCDGDLFQKLRSLFGEVEGNPLFKFLPDTEGLFFHISTASWMDDDDGQNWLKLARPYMFLRMIQNP